MNKFDPVQAMGKIKREFGEHGGVCPSVARSSTFTVLDPTIMPEIFEGMRGPDLGGCFLYSRHFNPTVDVLARYLAAMEGTEEAVCTASGMGAISSEIPPEDQAKMGLSPGLLRISVGITGGLEDRLDQLVAVVKKAGIA